MPPEEHPDRHKPVLVPPSSGTGAVSARPGFPWQAGAQQRGMPCPTLLVVDDHPLFRKALLQLLARGGDFNVVGEAGSGAQGLDLARQLAPDLILLDLNMKDMDGLTVLQTIKSWGTDVRVVMLTVSDGLGDVLAALRAGADGYLLKDMEPEELMVRLKEAAAGLTPFTERLTRLLAHALREQGAQSLPAETGLTEQQARILDQIAQGKSNKLIARELDLAESTVKVHVKHLLRKLNVRSRVEAAVWAAAQRK